MYWDFHYCSLYTVDTDHRTNLGKEQLESAIFYVSFWELVLYDSWINSACAFNVIQSSGKPDTYCFFCMLLDLVTVCDVFSRVL